MDTLGIADFEKLIMERLENPSLYENKSLLLWHAGYKKDSLTYRIITRCCVRFNRMFPDNQAWVKYSDFLFSTDDYTRIKALCSVKDMYGFKDHGILLNTGCYQPSMEKDWLTFINTHNNTVGHLSSHWSMIACVIDPKWEEASFGDNCTLYHLQPRIDEWYEWLKPVYPSGLLNSITEYMRKKDMATDSQEWLRLLDWLYMMMDRNNIEELSQLSHDDYNLELGGGFPASFLNDLWDFIHKQD